MNTKLLNGIQSLMIDFANKNNINLCDEFGTVENFKKFVVAFAIKTLVEKGMEIASAYDVVMGDGAYETLVNEVWSRCQLPHLGEQTPAAH